MTNSFKESIMNEANRKGMKQVDLAEVCGVNEVTMSRYLNLERTISLSAFMCSRCKWKEKVPTIMGEPIVWEHCPSCGAQMIAR